MEKPGCKSALDHEIRKFIFIYQKGWRREKIAHKIISA